MANAQKAKGSALELLLVKYLRPLFGEHVGRGVAGATDDRGDISGLTELTVEAKSYGSLGDGINAGLRDLPAEQANNGHRWGVVVAKRRGKGRAEDQVVAMTFGQFCDLYACALDGLEYERVRVLLEDRR